MKLLFKMMCLSCALVCAACAEELAPTPPMGWNSWNWWGKQAINEQVVRDTIDAMATNGLQAAGYEYIVVDGGWRDTKLGPDGKLLAHPEKFPHGIKPLADYAHSRGFKFGLHTCPGTHDCGGDKVGAWGIEDVHIGQFAEWGLDFVKVDKCQFRIPSEPEPVKKKKKIQKRKSGWNIGTNTIDAYTKWRKLLNECGRDIVLSASAYKFYDWYPVLTQMGRTTGDIACKYSGGALFDGKPKRHSSVMSIAEKNNEVARYAGNGYWNDPDMLVTGDQGLTQEEQQAHFALWCIMSSPLMIGSDPISMSKEELAILTNKTAIMVNQDPTEQGTRIIRNGTAEVWAKQLKGKQVAVLLLNRDKANAQNITLDFAQIGLSGQQEVLDIYANKSLGKADGKITKKVPSSAGLFLLIGE